MNALLKLLLPAIIGLTLINCSGNSGNRKIGSYKDLKKDLKGIDLEKTEPVADIGELESEVSNGGFNQYFFNSSGQNCFETLRALKKSGKIKTAEILETAIHLINPVNLSENDLIEKLRNREVQELDDSLVTQKLENLDQLFYKYPDGTLK